MRRSGAVVLSPHSTSVGTCTRRTSSIVVGFENSTAKRSIGDAAKKPAPANLGVLKKLAEAANFEWVAAAANGLADVERGMRRNLLRSLSLDAFATALERGESRAS